MEDPESKLIKDTPCELLKDDQKKQLSKNNKAKMTLYNALPHKEYGRVFMCKTANEDWHTLIIAHQVNSQVKNCKIALKNTNYSSKNHVRKFLRALPLKWRAKVKSLALKAKVTREQTSDDSDSQEGSDDDVDEEEAEAFNLMARNFRKFFRKGNRSGRGSRFGNGANRFGRGCGNRFGNKGGESSR
ncbi:hypothetical protein Tco_0722646 [Tanacetum coccineum]